MSTPQAAEQHPVPPVATQSGTVAVGPASKAGYGVALAGLIGAVVAYATGDHSQATLGSIVSASVGLISLAITQIGRYVQANSQIKHDAALQQLVSEGRTAVTTIQHYDPQALTELENVVRAAVKAELARLPQPEAALTGEVIDDATEEIAAPATNPLLPTPEEEAANQPPGAGGASPESPGSSGSPGSGGSPGSPGSGGAGAGGH